VTTILKKPAGGSLKIISETIGTQQVKTTGDIFTATFR